MASHEVPREELKLKAENLALTPAGWSFLPAPWSARPDKGQCGCELGAPASCSPPLHDREGGPSAPITCPICSWPPGGLTLSHLCTHPPLPICAPLPSHTFWLLLHL